MTPVAGGPTEADGALLLITAIGGAVLGMWLVAVALPWLAEQLEQLRAPKVARRAYSDHMRARASWKVTALDGIKPPRALARPRVSRRRVLKMAPKSGERSA